MEIEKIVPVAKSPLDAYRGRGMIARAKGLPVPPPATRLMTTGVEEETITYCMTLPKITKVSEGNKEVKTVGNPCCYPLLVISSRG